MAVLRFHRLAAATVTALARHVCAAAHPMPCWLRYFSASGEGHGKDRCSNDQDNAARQRRDHDVEPNTRVRRINANDGTITMFVR
ncbi:MAG: hypothetical protein DMF14_13035 [Verrucomicrobia bacterium]|nr:MAG: hypothetical protein DME40_06430 [Verrucomicrobiota bacterium]PYL86583.1 MAG: hypothetical protein DMF23_00465 [Verrucomicrobiota bacterium]PYL89494.1 MAG: hypothetical protein DMF14_13035 [Verrucomicrobiota bacterium]